MLLSRLGFQTGSPRHLPKLIHTPIHLPCRQQCVTARFTTNQTADGSALCPAAQCLEIYLPRDKKSPIGTHLLVLPIRGHVLTRSQSTFGPTLTLVVLPYTLHRVLVLARRTIHHHARITYKSSIRQLRPLRISTIAPNPILTHRSSHNPCGNTHLRRIITRNSPTDLTSEQFTFRLHAQGNRTTSLTVIWSISMGHPLRRSRRLCSSAC